MSLSSSPCLIELSCSKTPEPKKKTSRNSWGSLPQESDQIRKVIFENKKIMENRQLLIPQSGEKGQLKVLYGAMVDVFCVSLFVALQNRCKL